jgi:putative PIN family toxin of toxin-antitoxin system
MRVVVDTNAFVSAALKQSSWPGAVIRWLDKFGGLLKTTVTEAQVIEVLQRPYLAPKLPPSYLDNVRRILSKAEMVTIVERIAACRDPTDDKFLELAVNGRADLIVSGDADLLVLDTFRGIPIITPAVMAARMADVAQL